MLVVVGVFLIGYSRYERTHPVTATTVHPTNRGGSRCPPGRRC